METETLCEECDSPAGADCERCGRWHADQIALDDWNRELDRKRYEAWLRRCAEMAEAARQNPRRGWRGYL